MDDTVYSASWTNAQYDGLSNPDAAVENKIRF